jgi:chlorophyll/bacteriochlorophyll a synthase
VMMTVPQLLVVSMLFVWGRPVHALIVLGGVLGQFAAMRVLLRDPEGRAPWYNGTGVGLYVAGMMVTAFAIRGIA